MIFSLFKRTQVGNTILFVNEIPIESVGKILYGQDNSSSAGWVKKEFRWSFNRTHWASWTPLNQENLVSVSTGSNKYLFLEVRYVSSGTGTCTSFSLNYTPATGQVYAPPVEGVSTMDDKHILSDGCNDLGGTVKVFDTINITDAQTLCGKGCDYYLWRPNQKGEQPISSVTNLEQILANLSGAIQNNSIQAAVNVQGPGVGVYFHTVDKTIYFKTLLAGNKMFISDNSAGNITLSVDDASINQLFTLLGSLNGVNIGGGAGNIFKQRVGEDFQFRTIVAGAGGLTVNTIGDQVIISADASISEGLWTDPTPVSANVGGISGGDRFDGSTSIQILSKMLYEYFPPNINLSIAPASEGYYEKYSPFTPEVSIYGTFNNNEFVKVRITDISAYSSLAGGIGRIVYPDVSAGTFSFLDSFVSPNWDNLIYTIKVYNKVDTIIMPPAEASAAINFVNPYTWGVIDTTVTDISTGTNPVILENIIKGFLNGGHKLIVPKQSNLIDFIKDPSMGIKMKFIYAYDASYGFLNSIFDIRNNFNVTTSFESTNVNLTGIGPSPIPYKIYIKTHWVNVSPFKLIFNI